MTNSELHIDFDVKFNRLSSNVYLKTSPQQKDWYLNEAMFEKIYKVLNRKTNKAGEDVGDTKTNISDIEELFAYKTLPVYKVDDLNGKVILPNDFLHPLEVSVAVNKACKYTDVETSAQELKYAVIPLPTTALTTWNLLATVNAISTNLFVTADILNVIGTLPVEENYLLIDRVIEAVKKNASNLGFSIYWENFNGEYYKNSLILVQTTTSNWTALSSVYNGVTTGITIRSFNLNFILNLSPTKLVSARIGENEFEEREFKNPFKRSNRQSPLLYMVNGTLRIKLSDFNISTVTISYIRKPIKIDYYINQSIELGSRLGNKYRICQEIVDLAAANCAARSMTPNTQVLSNLTS